MGSKNFRLLEELLIQAFPHTKFISSDLPPKVFGCSAFVHIHQKNRTKLDPKSVKCIFLGYSTNQKGYKCYSPRNKKMYNSMDVTFFGGQPYYPKPEIQGEGMRENISFGTAFKTLQLSCTNLKMSHQLSCLTHILRLHPHQPMYLCPSHPKIYSLSHHRLHPIIISLQMRSKLPMYLEEASNLQMRNFMSTLEGEGPLSE